MRKLASSAAEIGVIDRSIDIVTQLIESNVRPDREVNDDALRFRPFLVGYANAGVEFQLLKMEAISSRIELGHVGSSYTTADFSNQQQLFGSDRPDNFVEPTITPERVPIWV